MAGNRDSFKKFLFMKILYFWLCCVLLTVCRFSVLAASGGHFLIAVLRLLTAEVSLVEEHTLYIVVSSVIVAHNLNFPWHVG